MTQIFKLQWPLSRSTDPILAYNKDRSETYHIPVTPEMAKLFGDDLKIYVKAEVVNGQFEIHRVTHARNW